MWQKERIIHELQKSGRRVTKQREILLEIILDGTWNCCKKIYYEAVEKDPSIEPATVCRMVGTLEEIGVFTRSYRYCLSARRPESDQPGA